MHDVVLHTYSLGSTVRKEVAVDKTTPRISFMDVRSGNYHKTRVVWSSCRRMLAYLWYCKMAVLQTHRIFDLGLDVYSTIVYIQVGV
jgi:hypothetical protein